MNVVQKIKEFRVQEMDSFREVLHRDLSFDEFELKLFKKAMAAAAMLFVVVPNAGAQQQGDSLRLHIKDSTFTLSAVEVSPDYAHAKVFFSVLVGEPDECQAGLNEAAGWLRNGLFKRLQIHTVPTLHFQFDRTTERAAEMNTLIRQANATRAQDD